MSKKTKFYKLLTGLLLLSTISFAQVATLEMTSGTPTNGAYNLTVPGSGFGPRSTSHVVTFVQDVLNNSNFTTHSPTVTGTFSLNNNYTGLTYGASTSNAVPTGLIFGAGPSLSTTSPAGGTVQQASPLNSYDLMGAWYTAGGGAPTNSMFTSNLGVAGTGLDAEGIAGGNDVNGGVQVFTCAQVLFDQAQPYGTANRYVYGDVVISFNRYVSNPVIHIAGLGGSYRYRPAGAPNNPANYLSAFFSTELEYVGPYSLTKLSSNSYMTVSGKNILNNSATPNGGSTSNTGTFNNEGAATGSIKINGTVNSIVLRVYLRGSDASQFGWSSAGVGVVHDATRTPLTGDIWYVSTSFETAQLIPLPVTGVVLKAVLNGNDVSLNWKTQTELNSKQFEIERSTDGINFSQIAVKQAAGNTLTEVQYSQIDPNMSSSVYYYRLRMVDIDGKFTYSNVVVVRKSGGVKGVRTFPNPVASQVNLEFSNAKGNYEVSVFSQNGQQVITQKASINNTVQYVTIDRKNLSSGSYFVRVKNTENGEVLFSDKIILQ